MMNNKELEWKAIEAAPGYWINIVGDIKGKRGNNLKHNNGNQGYKQITLSLKIDGVQVKKTAYVHRLLAEAFLPKPDENMGYVVSHKNGMVADNRLENLEWRSAVEHLVRAGCLGRAASIVSRTKV